MSEGLLYFRSHFLFGGRSCGCPCLSSFPSFLSCNQLFRFRPQQRPLSCSVGSFLGRPSSPLPSSRPKSVVNCRKFGHLYLVQIPPGVVRINFRTAGLRRLKTMRLWMPLFRLGNSMPALLQPLLRRKMWYSRWYPTPLCPFRRGHVWDPGPTCGGCSFGLCFE